MPWTGDAACARPPYDEWDWWPPRDAVAARVLPLIKVCSECPVRAECLRTALQTRSVGVWGGTTSTDRSGLLRKAISTIDPDPNVWGPASETAPPDPEEVEAAAQLLEADLPRRLVALREKAARGRGGARPRP
ncbi:MAG: WhiB family transcriptional regulator [Actinomycetota bacterium]